MSRVSKQIFRQSAAILQRQEALLRLHTTATAAAAAAPEEGETEEETAEEEEERMGFSESLSRPSPPPLLLPESLEQELHRMFHLLTFITELPLGPDGLLPWISGVDYTLLAVSLVQGIQQRRLSASSSSSTATATAEDDDTVAMLTTKRRKVFVCRDSVLLLRPSALLLSSSAEQQHLQQKQGNQTQQASSTKSMRKASLRSTRATRRNSIASGEQDGEDEDSDQSAPQCSSSSILGFLDDAEIQISLLQLPDPHPVSTAAVQHFLTLHRDPRASSSSSSSPSAVSSKSFSAVEVLCRRRHPKDAEQPAEGDVRMGKKKKKKKKTKRMKQREGLLQFAAGCRTLGSLRTSVSQLCTFAASPALPGGSVGGENTKDSLKGGIRNGISNHDADGDDPHPAPVLKDGRRRRRICLDLQPSSPISVHPEETISGEGEGKIRRKQNDGHHDRSMPPIRLSAEIGFSDPEAFLDAAAKNLCQKFLRAYLSLRGRSSLSTAKGSFSQFVFFFSALLLRNHLLLPSSSSQMHAWSCSFLMSVFSSLESTLVPS